MNRLFLALFALVLAIPLAGCQSRGVSPSDTLKIGAYSVVREVIPRRPDSRLRGPLEKQDRPRGSVRGVVQRLRRPGPGDRLGFRRRPGDPVA